MCKFIVKTLNLTKESGTYREKSNRFQGTTVEIDCDLFSEIEDEKKEMAMR
jgi:hypothetical protein